MYLLHSLLIMTMSKHRIKSTEWIDKLKSYMLIEEFVLEKVTTQLLLGKIS